ncbi:MAG: hypothetical protein LBC19_04945, partial [Tannerella sp.]|nr:hypothetical protein [Tannerella sp.]
DSDNTAGGSNVKEETLTWTDEKKLAGIADSVKSNETAGNEKSKGNKRVIDWLALSSENTEPKQSDRSTSSATTAKQTPKQAEQKSSNKATVATTSTAAVKPKNAQAEKTIPANVRMTAGSSLTQLAMEHYGDKVFWVYIYDYNKNRIKDFNNIPVGMEIRLPQPKLYSINAKNKSSLQKARQKQSELLKWDDYQ